MAEHSVRSSTSEADRYAHSLIAVSRNPLVSIDSQGRITDANAAVVEAVGIPRDSNHQTIVPGAGGRPPSELCGRVWRECRSRRLHLTA